MEEGSAQVKILRTIFRELLHAEQIREAIINWRFTVPLTLGMVAASVLWCLADDPVEGTICFFLVLAVGIVSGLYWNRSTLK
jgi:hypothetical protein